MKLVPHPDCPARSIDGVEVDWRSDGAMLALTYCVRGSAPLLPPPAMPARTDDLWQATCFELFLRAPDDASYAEFNFSPSGQWAAYVFDDYRQGMRDLPLRRDPVVAIGDDADFSLSVDLDLAGLWQGTMRAAFTAILMEPDGTKSYWSLAHPPGKPDFHDPACFALELPAPSLP